MNKSNLWIYALTGLAALIFFAALGIWNYVSVSSILPPDIHDEITRSVLCFGASLIVGFLIFVVCIHTMDIAVCARIHEENKRIRTIIDSEDNLFFTYSIHTKECNWYGDAGKLFGVINGRQAPEKLSHPDDFPILLQQFEDTKRSKDYSIDIRLLDAKGTYRMCSCRMIPMKNAIGRVKSVLGIVRSVDA